MSNPIAIIDTHCHYNLEPLYPDWRRHWEQAQAAGVVGAVVVGTTEETSERACEIAAADPRLVAAVGIHPNYAAAQIEEITVDSLATLVERLGTVGPVVAIGETGLDYFRVRGSAEEVARLQQKQQRACLAHLALATKLQLPILLHVRDSGEAAYHTIIDLIKPFAAKLQIILHCFSGPDWYLTQALALDCYISFAGNSTYPTAENLRDHLRKVPRGRLLVETDAPFLPPQQHRGQTCLPSYIAETVAFLRSELQVEPSQLLTNARALLTTIPIHT